MKPIHPNRKNIELEIHDLLITKNAKKKIHLEHVKIFSKTISAVMTITGLKRRGLKNALDIQIRKSDLTFHNLPRSFDGFRILFLTDLHFRQSQPFVNTIIKAIGNTEYDLCILGGDYQYHFRGDPATTHIQLEVLINHLLEKSPIFSILGNHDLYHTAEFLNQKGVTVLLNEGVSIEKNNDKICFVGLDDCHYYNAYDFETAEENISENDFKILLCHSPELYREATRRGYYLYLAGHTHAGQICLPGEIPIVVNANIPRKFAKDKWKYEAMQGYTCRGTGFSSVGVRFNCPPEIALLTLGVQDSK